MNGELVVSAIRERLKKERDDAAIQLAGTLRSGAMNDAVVRSGYIKALEDAYDWVGEIVQKINSGEYS